MCGDDMPCYNNMVWWCMVMCGVMCRVTITWYGDVWCYNNMVWWCVVMCGVTITWYGDVWWCDVPCYNNMVWWCVVMCGVMCRVTITWHGDVWCGVNKCAMQCSKFRCDSMSCGVGMIPGEYYANTCVMHYALCISYMIYNNIICFFGTISRSRNIFIWTCHTFG